MEILDHVMPPLLSLWVGEVREGGGARPDLEGKRSQASKAIGKPLCVTMLCLLASLEH